MHVGQLALKVGEGLQGLIVRVAKLQAPTGRGGRMLRG